MAEKVYPPRRVSSWADTAPLGELLGALRNARALEKEPGISDAWVKRFREIGDAAAEAIEFRCYRKEKSEGAP